MASSIERFDRKYLKGSNLAINGILYVLDNAYMFDECKTVRIISLMKGYRRCRTTRKKIRGKETFRFYNKKWKQES